MKYIIPVSFQPMPSSREQDELWQPTSLEIEELDPLFNEAVAFVVEKGRASIAGVQRQFRIGYQRAASIIEQMETQGVVCSPNHNGQREIL